jgi:ubiquitin-protein ligase
MLTEELINEMKIILNEYNNIKLIKYNNNYNDIIIYLNILINNSFEIIKLITDLNTYCYIDNNDNMYEFINNFNLTILFEPKNLKIIFIEMNNCINNSLIKKNNNIDIDYFHINQSIEEYNKSKINYIELEKNYNTFTNNLKNINNIIPKELLFTSSQIIKLIIKEIKIINCSRKYNHYIVLDYNDPYRLVIRLLFDNNTNIGKILNNINNSYGYNYIEFTITLDSKSYPFIPPKINYNKPNINNELLLGLLDLNILKISNWNPTITLEYLILNIAKFFEESGYKYINSDISLNNQDIAFNSFDYDLIKLSHITKDNYINRISININVPKINTAILNNNYWKAGTGFSTGNISKWDINSYIEDQEINNKEIISILFNIITFIKSNTIINYNLINIVFSYLSNQLTEITLLEIQKYKELYNHIFILLELIIINKFDDKFIIDIGKKIKNLYEELTLFITNENSPDAQLDITNIYNIIKLYIIRYDEYLSLNEIIISNIDQSINETEYYCNIMKSLQFNTCDLQSSHKYFKYKNNKLQQKSLIPVLSEISGFKSGLPINWDSSIWIRIPKDNYNIFTFLISGPKDTPYENGLFEFHGYFPEDYPNSVPQVLLNTTGPNKFRFNPNLYGCGKVCLSLLNTWNGLDNEKWNSKTSTFIQVIISIQSLILVEDPYFNEPGYEKIMNTPEGNLKSQIYNEEIYPNTIKLCMIDMINNPPLGYEEVISNHFKFKKTEIIKKIIKWENKSNKYKNDINKYRLELELLLNK